MIRRKKYDLAKMLEEIEEDSNEQVQDLTQEKNIPQDIITERMLENLRQKKEKKT